ncbi:MAG: YlmC/YmxH family sporulation protein [Syntrophomonas sp.]|jgi:YlmC/YmxH family sporulation protein|nr:YlmC/YmxH family sporulation protein [Syntrophomonas sp.]
MVKLSDLRTREVINVLDGKKLGSITDIDLDIERGRVLALMLPGQVRGWSVFARREEIVVPWDKIVRIGRDVILVELPTFGDIEPQFNNGCYRDDENKY